MTQVSPSLLASDFTRLGEAVGTINRSHASMIHVDVMDGMFVPNISIGFPVISAISRVAEKPLDVHMMVTDPGRYINEVRDSGGWLMCVHYEACTHLHRDISAIHDAGMKAGVALNHATPVELLEDIIDDVDLVLLMSVNPGFGGQKFIPNTISKVKRLRQMIARRNSGAMIEIDGGVDLTTAPALIAAGADVLVAGSFVFKAPDPIGAINALSELG